MLYFVLGRSGTGKTTYIRNMLSELCKNGEQKLMMLVPDQSSFETEKSFYEILGPKDSRNIKVFGFSRLCDYIFSQSQCMRSNPIDEGTRSIIMSLALEQVQDKLELFSQQKGRRSVLELMVYSYKECAKCNITPEMLLDTSMLVEEAALAQKLKETSYVLSAYEAIIANTYVDPCEDLTRAYEILLENPLFEDYTIAVDSFSGFTAQQYGVLERLMKQSKGFYASLTMDSGEEIPCEAFKTTFETKNRLLNIAQKNGVETAPCILLEENRRFKSKELLYAEKSLYRINTVPCPDAPENVKIVSCTDARREAEYTANNIRKLVIENNYSYGDIAVICRDCSGYFSYIQSEFSKNNIPCFTDYPEDIFIKPVIRLVCSCFNCVMNNFDREDVLSLLKTGLTDNSLYDISVFENYLYARSINRAGLKQEFTQNPSGFSKSLTDYDYKILSVAEKVRASVIEPLILFKEKCSDSDGTAISAALYELLLELKVPERLDNLYDTLEAQGRPDLANQQIRLWNILMSVLDKMTAVLKAAPITIKRYYELLTIQFENAAISDIPSGIDSVRFGDAMRIRLDSVKAVFIIGANEGEFPLIQSVAGVFSETERKYLAAYELNLENSVEALYDHERFLAYSCLTAPCEKLFVLFHTSNIKNTASEPSEFVTELLRIYPKIKITDAFCEPVSEKLWSKKSAFEYCAGAFTENDGFSQLLREYFYSDGDYSQKLLTISKILKNEPIRLEKKENSIKLFGDNPILSASQIENYGKCAFQYFCNYGLKVCERRPVQIDALEFGTITHYFFEKFFSEYNRDAFSSMTEAQLEASVDKIYLEYANEYLGGLEDKSPRFLNLYDRIKENSLNLITHLISELSASRFVPVDYELKIGGDIPFLTLSLPSGGSVSVRGSVDRVDLMEKDGRQYIRVIDYKTGGKDFVLSDVLYGLNLQMLIYLHAIEKNGAERYGNSIVPSGILYMPAIASPASFKVGEEPEKIKNFLEAELKMNGVILNDADVVNGMDPSGRGRFIPVTVKGGTPCSANSLATLEEMGRIFSKIDKTVIEMAESLGNGEISAVPIKGKKLDGCEYCPYDSVCNYKQGGKYKYAEDFSAAKVMEILREEEKENG